jgi:predicted 2-oxoglutarate/Fe(II)-dependent dioxygenase YbiX
MKIDTDIKSYVKVYKVISDDSCDRIISEIKNNKWSKHTYHDPNTNISSSLNGDRELEISYSDSIELTEYVTKAVYNSLKQYVTDLNFLWFGGWTDFSDVRFNRYSENQIMSEHCDHIHSCFDGNKKGIPILSVLGCLNDDYQGGDFIMWGDEKLNIGKGEIIVFPSNFLYPHLVLQVTSGVRYSFVSWAW